MQQFHGRVHEVEPIGTAHRILWISSPLLTPMTGGEFVMVRCGESLDPMLRRALSLHRTAREDGAVGFMFTLGKTWSNWLGGRRPGDEISLIGPLGTGFRRDKAARHLLILAEGFGISAVVASAEEALRAGCAVTLVHDAPTASMLYPAERLNPEIEIVLLTADGSAGKQGGCLDALPDYLPWADQIFLAGSGRLIDGVKAALKRTLSRTPAQVIVEERMACGVGACLGCVVATKDGLVPSCVHGPVFDVWGLAA